MDLLKSMDDDLLLISADNLPTWGTLQLIEKSVNKKTRALTFRPKDGFVSDWIVEGEEILQRIVPRLLNIRKFDFGWSCGNRSRGSKQLRTILFFKRRFRHKRCAL